MLKRTPLYDVHVRSNAKMVDFGGWEMPVQYTSIIGEHHAVRQSAGIFDVSHMGELLITGTDAIQFINSIVTNDISRMKPGRIVYSPVCNERGGVVDDLLVYMLNADKYLLVVNAGNTDKIYEWFLNHNHSNCEVINVSDDYAQIALQGPKSQEILQRLTDSDLSGIGYYRFANISVAGIDSIVSRTGYTGEDGFEIYLSPQHAEGMWNAILKAEPSVLLAGLGARDTLRLEAGLPLHGHEISDDITPVEARLKSFIKPDKDEFIGKDVLVRQMSGETDKILIGLETEKGIPRNGYEVLYGDKLIGIVTSGTHSPTLNKGIGMALVDKQFAEEGAVLNVQIRGKAHTAHVVKLPFYRRKK